jgi:hypothetical protein
MRLPWVLYVVGGVSVGFWGSIDRSSGIEDARKKISINILYARRVKNATDSYRQDALLKIFGILSF